MGINLADHGYNDVSAALPGEFFSLPAGGYICLVVNADLTKSKAGNPMLVLFLDIAHGDFKGYFKAAVDRVKSFDPSKQWDYSAIYRQLIFDNQGKVARFFKGLLSAFQKSNPNLNLNIHNFEPDVLAGKLIGMIFAEEEYEKRDGSIATRSFAKFPKSVPDIQAGHFSVPELKKLVKTSNTSKDDFDGSSVDPNDLPF